MNTVIMIANTLVVFGIIGILFFKRKSRLAERAGLKGFFKESRLFNTRLLKWANPYYVREQGKIAVDSYSFRRYWLMVMGGTAISIFFIFVVLQMYYLFPLGIMGGFALPNIIIFFQKRKREDQVMGELSAYINTLANLTTIYGDMYKGMSEVLSNNFIKEPIRSDLIRVMTKLENGIPVEEAFDEFNQKFDNLFVNVFHDNLILFDRYGGDMNDVLIDSAKDYDKALDKRKMNRLIKDERRKEFYTLMILLIAFPFVLLGISYEYYQEFVHSLIGKGVLFVMILTGVFSAMRIEFKYDHDEIFIKTKTSNLNRQEVNT